MVRHLVGAAFLLAVPSLAGAVCRSDRCPDPLALDDLRARVAARCDCEGASDPRAWMRCVKQVTKDAAARNEVPRGCAKAARRCEAKATCGRGGAVVCCGTTRKGRVKARIVRDASRCGGAVCTAHPAASDACRPDGTCGPPPRRDPGTNEWDLVPEDRVAEECGLDPARLRAADAVIDRPYAVVRYGKLCHEHYPAGTSADDVDEAFSTTKTLGALVTGVAAYQTRDLPNTGRKTGPLSDLDRVDHWLDAFTFNADARIAHVLAMVAHNPDLSFEAKTYEYDIVGTVQINRLSDVINTAIAQDPERLGADLEEFTRRFLFGPLGMTSSVWSRGAPDKIFAFTWQTTVREMARIGLLMLNGGIWSGERLVAEDWIYRMTHAAFEDSNTSYGYLTWLATDTDFGLGLCAPPAIHASYPHGLSESPDCRFGPRRSCEQENDVGVWYALGLGGQVIMGQRGLDLVLVAKNLGDAGGTETLWGAVRPALVALDPTFAGDEASFCAAYDGSEYAPDLR